jgi:hypothetical protein
MRRGSTNAVCLVIAICLSACGDKPSGSGSSAVTGTWEGSMTGVGPPASIQFKLLEENGVVTGQTFYADPKTGEFVMGPELTGSRQGVDATWTTVTGVVVAGKFDGSAFAGTIRFPLEDPAGNPAPYTANLSLKR